MTILLTASHRLTPLLLLQRQSELQQSGRAGAAEAAGEAERSGGGHGAQCGGTSQPAHPTSHGSQKPQQTVPGLAGLGVDLREGELPPGKWNCSCTLTQVSVSYRVKETINCVAGMVEPEGLL